MSYEFKKLGEVESVSTLPVTANALVEIDGAVRRVPAGVLASAPLVILPETEVAGEGPQYNLLAPLENAPTAGGTYKIVWDGVEYVSPALDVTETMGEGMPTFAFGDTSIIFEEEAPALGNPVPGAPYFLMLVPNGTQLNEGEPLTYGVFLSTTEPTNPTLSIVQVGAASGGESAGGGIFEVNVPVTAFGVDGHDFGAFDKSFAELVAALKGGKTVRINVNFDGGQTTYGTVRAYGTMQGRECVMIDIPRTMMTAGQHAMYGMFAGENGEIVTSYLTD